MRNTRARKPTRAHKISMAEAGLDWRTWLVADEDSIFLRLVSKKSGRRKVIWK